MLTQKFSTSNSLTYPAVNSIKRLKQEEWMIFPWWNNVLWLSVGD